MDFEVVHALMLCYRSSHSYETDESLKRSLLFNKGKMFAITFESLSNSIHAFGYWNRNSAQFFRKHFLSFCILSNIVIWSKSREKKRWKSLSLLQFADTFRFACHNSHVCVHRLSRKVLCRWCVSKFCDCVLLLILRYICLLLVGGWCKEQPN